MRVYIACGLTHVPRQEFEAYVALIHTVAASIESGGAEVRYALRDSDPQLAERPPADRARLCYIWDREMVEWADVVVAEASYPSIGLGIELQIAAQRSTPIVICFARTVGHRAPPAEYENPDHTHHALQIGEGYVSLMGLGIPSVFSVIGYADSTDAVASIDQSLRQLSNPALHNEAHS